MEVDAFGKWNGQKGVLAFPTVDYRASFKLLAVSFQKLNQPPLSTLYDIHYNFRVINKNLWGISLGQQGKPYRASVGSDMK